MLWTILLHICSTLSQVSETCLAPPSEPVISYGEQNPGNRKGPCAVSRVHNKKSVQLPYGINCHHLGSMTRRSIGGEVVAAACS